MTRKLVFFDEHDKRVNEHLAEQFSMFENAETSACCTTLLCCSRASLFKLVGSSFLALKNLCCSCCSTSDKCLLALDKIRNDQIALRDKSLKAIMSEKDGGEKEVSFKNLPAFAKCLAELKKDCKLTTLGETARYQLFASLPAVNENLISYQIPINNGDMDTSRWRIIKRGKNVIFEVDTISACLIWVRGFKLFVGKELFPLALVIDD